MPPQGLDPEEQWLWVDPVKKSGWTHRTATDAVVRYQSVKVQAWDAVAPTEFSTNRRLRTHIPDITHPTLYSTNAPCTMLGWGEVIRSDNLDWGLYNKKFSVWESSWTKQRGYIENKGVFVQAEQGM